MFYMKSDDFILIDYIIVIHCDILISIFYDSQDYLIFVPYQLI